MGDRPEVLGKLPQINEIEIGDGLQGNLQTIDFMKKIARDRCGKPEIRRLVENILLHYKIPSNHYVQEALAIGDYVKSKVRYIRDPDGIEYLQDPLDLIKKIQDGTAQGDCDDMALLTATLLLSAGFDDVRFRAVRFYEPVGNFNHIYVVVYDKDPYQKNQRVTLDCILKTKPIGTELPHNSGEEYNV